MSFLGDSGFNSNITFLKILSWSCNLKIPLCLIHFLSLFPFRHFLCYCWPLLNIIIHVFVYYLRFHVPQPATRHLNINSMTVGAYSFFLFEILLTGPGYSRNSTFGEYDSACDHSLCPHASSLKSPPLTNVPSVMQRKPQWFPCSSPSTSSTVSCLRALAGTFPSTLECSDHRSLHALCFHLFQISSQYTLMP